MIQVVSSKSSSKIIYPPISQWVIGSFIATIVLIYTTFSNVIEVPVVSNYVGGSIFGTAGYVGGLATKFSPWLPKMMAESTGVSTARLLRVGSIALAGLEVIAIATLVSLALHLILYFKRKTRPARIFGILGFALGLVVPILMFVVVRFVAWQMTNDLVALNVLAVPTGPRIQLVAAVVGCACVILATKNNANTRQGR